MKIINIFICWLPKAISIGLLFIFLACGSSNPIQEYPFDEELFGAILPLEEERGSFPRALPLEALQPSGKFFKTGSFPSNSIITDTPPIGQQGSVGSCISWSGAYGLGSYTAALTQGWDVQDPNNEISVAWMYETILNQEGRTCPTGSIETDYLNYLVQFGAVSQSDVGYEANCTYLNGVNLGLTPDPDFRIGSWLSIPPKDRNLIIDYLAVGYPLSFAGHLYDGFPQLKTTDVYYGSGPFMVNPKTGKLVGHGMLLIGYNEDLGDPAKALGAYRIQNSFGTDWGDEGFLWMSYGTFENSILTVFHAVPYESFNANEGVPLQATGGGSDAPQANATSAYQYLQNNPDGSSVVYLIVFYNFSSPVLVTAFSVTGPDGGTMSHPIDAWQNNGYNFYSRVDGGQYPSGNYQVQISTTTVSGETVEYSGDVNIAALNPGPAPLPLGPEITGGTGQPVDYLPGP